TVRATLSLHDALPIFARLPHAPARRRRAGPRDRRLAVEWRDVGRVPADRLTARCLLPAACYTDQRSDFSSASRGVAAAARVAARSEEHTSELQSRENL